MPVGGLENVDGLIEPRQPDQGHAEPIACHGIAGVQTDGSFQLPCGADGVTSEVQPIPAQRGPRLRTTGVKFQRPLCLHLRFLPQTGPLACVATAFPKITPGCREPCVRAAVVRVESQGFLEQPRRPSIAVRSSLVPVITPDQEPLVRVPRSSLSLLQGR